MKTTTREQILNCSDFNQLLNAEYGERGTQTREQFEAEAEAFVLGEILRQERKSAGLTQQQLAEQSGYNKTTISRLEKGSSKVSLSSIFHIFAGMGRKVAISVLSLTLLLTLGVGQMWADAWVCRTTNGGEIAVKTVGDKLNNGNEWNYTYKTNGGWSSETDIQVLVGTSNTSYTAVNAGWVSDDGSNKNVAANIGNVQFDKSGKWYAVGKYYDCYTQGNNSWVRNTTLDIAGNTPPYWTVNPPAVSSFAVSTTGSSSILSGTGTSADPYIISYNGSLKLTLSGSKAATDANSSLEYNTNGTWNSTTTRTISSITSTTKTSVTVKMRCYNSSASLSGDESSKTIYYQSEASYNVTAAKTPSAGGSVTPTSATAMGTTSGGNITATPSTGYNFGSWAITSGSGYFGASGTATTSTTANTKFRPSAASTVTATFTAKTTTVTLSANAPGGQTVTGGGTTVTATYDAALPAFSALTCTGGYALKGYYDNTSGGNKIINANGSFNANSGIWNRTDGATLTLHAQWSLDRTLTYDGNENTSGDVPAGPAVYANGASATVLGNTGSLAKTGYTFNNWNTAPGGGGSSYSAGNTITMNANYTLYAQWRENNYTVTVNAGSNGSVASGSVTGHYDTKVTLPTATPNTGYHFSTWTTTSGTVTYTDQTSATAAQVNGLTAAATVRADFAANTYSVVFNKNGGTGTMSNQAFTYNAAATALTSNSYTYSGYTFLGWATTAEKANALTVDYTDGQSVRNLTTTHNGTFNLYAVWAKKYYIGGRFQHDWEEGTASTNEMTYDASSGYYKFASNKTVNELSVQWHNGGSYYADQYFYIHTGLGKGASSSQPTYVGASSNGHDMETKIGYSNAYVLTEKTSSFDSFTDAMLLKFSNTDNLSSDVIVWWDPANRKVWYTATESLNTNYYLLGFGESSWSETDARCFKVASVNATTATVTVSLTAKTYTGTNDGFKLEKGGAWYGNSGTMTRANCTGWVFSTGESSNCSITADLAGTYTFTLNLSNMQVSATYPTAYQLNYSIGDIAGTSGTISTSPSTASGSYVASGNTVRLTAPNEKTGYTWKGWYLNSNGSGVQQCATKAYDLTMSADKTLYACYTENEYNVTVSNDGHGSVSPTGTVAIKQVTGTTLTATPSTNYIFKDWTISGGGITPNTSSTSPQTFKATTTGGTIRANFADQWSICGIPNWSTWNGLPYKSSNVFEGTITLTVGNHSLKVVDRKTGTWYTKNGSIITRGSATVTASETGGSDNNITITADVAGEYTFNFNTSTKVLTVTYPTAYTVTYGVGTLNGSSSAISVSPSFTSGDYVLPETDLTFSKGSTNAGYTWKGWYSNVAGTGDAWSTTDGSLSLTATRTGNISVYACYTYATYTASLDNSGTGHGTGGLSSVTATYNTAMPTIAAVNLPTAANGYAFMGYWDDEDGEGTQYYNADGTSAHVWDKTDDADLYAYFKKAEITALTFDAGTVEPGATVGVTPTISPTPVAPTIICWTILHSNDTPLDPQPAMTWSAGKLTFAASAYSGTYKVQAVLRTGDACGAGDPLDTETASFLVAGSHSVTVNYKCSSDVIKTATSVTGRPTEWSDDITAPDIFGYTFSSWSSADGVTIKDSKNEDVTSSTEATIKIKATYAGSLTANYTQNQMIFFKNTLGWDNVYVNFYTGSYWNNPLGSGNQGVTNKNLTMTQYGESDIWYYDYGASSISPSLYVSFTSKSQDGAEHFWHTDGVDVVYPANYADNIHSDRAAENGFKAATPMFVPLAAQEYVLLNGTAHYYNAGYWSKYTPGTGYRLEIYNEAGNSMIKYKDFESADDLMPMKAVIDLEGGQTYKFQIRRGGESSAGIYYGNSGTMDYTNHGQDVAWDLTNYPSMSKAGITTNAAGDYTFNLSYSAYHNPESDIDEYRLRIAVDYPVASGDYRLVYTDDVHTNPHPSAIVNKVNDGTDIVSFFVRHDQNPVVRIQQATVHPSTGAITWNEYPNSGTQTNQITGTIASTISSSGTEVYNFNLSMNGSGALTVASAEVYDGNFYIRTDAASSKWDNYRTDPDHRMIYSEYSITHGGYTHYYTHWVDKDVTGRKNVKFCIANDYSPCISDTLAREEATGTWEHIADFMEEGGDLKRSANVRYMWDKRDNTISRAYVDGAQTAGTQFLTILSADEKILNPSTSEVQAITTFSDKGNWMYEANIKAIPGAQIKLKSSWGKAGETDHIIDQYFRGASDATEQLIGGSGSSPYDIRAIYDFKSNRLIAGLIPSGTIDEQMAIHADVMFVREHHGDIAQLTFAEKDSKMGAITDIETAYGVLQFNKWTINNKSKETGHAPLSPLLSQFERDLFYVSFPFKVAMEDVFGFGTYGQHWIIEYYDGATRASKGYWAESGPNWKFVTNRKGKYFEPGQGYIIALDLDEMGESADIWANTDRVELYFPSYGTMDNITSSTATYEIPEHECTINRSNESNGHGGTLGPQYDRRVKDSHWNVLGVPTYVNPEAPNFANTAWTSSATETSIGPNFLYQWSMTDNTVSPVSASGYTYHAMHAYLVQYCGDVTWTSSVSVTPPSIVARRTYDEAPRSVEFRLELTQNDVAVDQTFVKLSDNEAVTTGFEFNFDLSKEFNKNRANIYTLIGTEQVAGNVLPLTDQTTVVPVGVSIPTAGDYTFSLPDGTEGIGVTLIDNQTGIRTRLSALDYTVNLTAGTHDGRFILEISPIHNATTEVELINGANGANDEIGARKVLIDGILYIVKGDKLYDVRGTMIK